MGDNYMEHLKAKEENCIQEWERRWI